VTFIHVHPVGDGTGEPPELYWNLMVEIPLSPRMHPDAIERLRSRVWNTLSDALDSALRPYTLPNSAGVTLYTALGTGLDAPTFPLTFGNVKLAAHCDIVDVIEVACQGTAITQLGFDHEGRAYELAADVEYIRRPESDRQPSRSRTTTKSRER
jgi:hypothetical protein